MRDILDGLSQVDKDEVLAAAADVANGKLWELTFQRLEAHYVDVMKGEPVGSLTAQDAHASLRVLGQVLQEIRLASASERVRSRRQT